MNTGSALPPVSRPDRVYLWVAIAVVSVVALAALGAAIWMASGAGGYVGYGPMGWGGGWGWFLPLMMVIPAAFVILVLFLILRAAVPARTVTMSETLSEPMQQLQLRYARGEINSEQYHQIASDLSGRR